ncbi:hypothetical protein VDG1235_3096 [Verrucomicrobiia bacterium DG1235]|nr:hypothetical protein VDG1235_3096 [Verrucomicrobiae bacterium DG1235]
MKFSILLRLTIGLGIAVFIFASALRASLEDILAPLPMAEVAAVSKPSLRTLESVVAVSPIVKSPPVEVEEEYAADSILASDVHEAVVAAMQESLRPAGDLTLVPLRDLPDLSSYSHPFAVNLITVPGRLSRGNVLLRFQVENEEGILGEWSVPFRVHLFSEVWYPRAHLRRGDLATPSDFDIRQVDLLAEPDAVPAGSREPASPRVQQGYYTRQTA